MTEKNREKQPIKMQVRPCGMNYRIPAPSPMLLSSLGGCTVVLIAVFKFP